MSPQQQGLQFDEDTLQRIAQARAAGHDPNQVLQKAAAYQAAKAPPKQTSLLEKATGLLPLLGGLAGSFIPGAGTIVGGALGAGAGTFIKQKLKGEQTNLGEIGKEAAFAGAGGALGEGLGFLGSKLLPKAAGAAGDLGETLAAKAFRVTPSQATNFAEETGEAFGKFLTKRGLTNPNNLDEAIKVIQEPFDQVVMSSGLKIAPEAVGAEFSKRFAVLNKSIAPADQAKKEALKEIWNNFMAQYGDAPIPAEALTTLRKTIDEGIKNFGLDESVKGPLNLTRDALQSAMRNTADEAGLTVGGMSLKDSGIELSKLYKAQEIATRQGNLGVGSLPLGLTKLLGGAVGGATGGIPGAITGIAATEAINNPANIGILSKLATKFSQGAGAIPQLSPGAGAALSRGGVGAGSVAASAMGGGQQPQPLPMPGGVSPDYLMAQASGAPSFQGGGPTGMPSQMGVSQEDQLKQAIGALMFSKAKSTGDIASAYKFMFPGGEGGGGTPTEIKLRSQATSGLRALDTVSQIIQQDPTAPIKASLPIVKGRSPYAAAANEVKDAFLRIRTGAQINESEMRFYESQLPGVFDSPETVNYKIGIFRQLFQDIADGLYSAKPDTSGAVDAEIISY